MAVLIVLAAARRTLCAFVPGFGHLHPASGKAQANLISRGALFGSLPSGHVICQHLERRRISAEEVSAFEEKGSGLMQLKWAELRAPLSCWHQLLPLQLSRCQLGRISPGLFNVLKGDTYPKPPLLSSVYCQMSVLPIHPAFSPTMSSGVRLQTGSDAQERFVHADPMTKLGHSNLQGTHFQGILIESDATFKSMPVPTSSVLYFGAQPRLGKLQLCLSTATRSKSAPLLLLRHFSDHRKSLGARPKAAQSRTIRLAAQSVNTVVEPYKKPASLPLWRRWLTLAGWRVQKDIVMSHLKTGYAVAKVKRAVPGYSIALFFQDVTAIYLSVNKALAAGDVSALRSLVTERTLAQMKQELEFRQKGGWERVTWELPKPSAIQRKTVHGRLVGVDPKNTSMAFAQITVRLQSLQKFAAYDRKGKVVAGSPDQELLVEDHWVFERPLWLKDGQWRLCGRLTL